MCAHVIGILTCVSDSYKSHEIGHLRLDFSSDTLNVFFQFFISVCTHSLFSARNCTKSPIIAENVIFKCVVSRVAEYIFEVQLKISLTLSIFSEMFQLNASYLTLTFVRVHVYVNKLKSWWTCSSFLNAFFVFSWSIACHGVNKRYFHELLIHRRLRFLAFSRSVEFEGSGLSITTVLKSYIN